MGDVLTDLLGTGAASDYSQPISGASAGATIVDNSPLPSASGSSMMSSVGDTLVNALKAVAGYSLQKDQIAVQQTAASRGYTPVGYGITPTPATLVQQSSNLMPILLIGGVALFAFMALRK